jgi:hypothetical protein
MSRCVVGEVSDMDGTFSEGVWTMSTISSVSADSSLYQFEQKINQTSGTSSDGSSQAVHGKHHGHHHGGGGGGGGMFQQVASAVTSALQAAQTQTSGGATDVNQVITQAITQALQQNGSSTSNPSTSGSLNSSSNIQNFYQTLQSAGVTPDQFRTDFMAALKAVMGDQASTSSAASGNLVNTTA